MQQSKLVALIVFCFSRNFVTFREKDRAARGVKTRTPGMQLRARNLIHFRRQFSRPPFHVKFQFPRPPFGEGRLVLKPLGSLATFRFWGHTPLPFPNVSAPPPPGEPHVRAIHNRWQENPKFAQSHTPSTQSLARKPRASWYRLELWQCWQEWIWCVITRIKSDHKSPKSKKNTWKAELRHVAAF